MRKDTHLTHIGDLHEIWKVGASNKTEKAADKESASKPT